MVDPGVAKIIKWALFFGCRVTVAYKPHKNESDVKSVAGIIKDFSHGILSVKSYVFQGLVTTIESDAIVNVFPYPVRTEGENEEKPEGETEGMAIKEKLHRAYEQDKYVIVNWCEITRTGKVLAFDPVSYNKEWSMQYKVGEGKDWESISVDQIDSVEILDSWDPKDNVADHNEETPEGKRCMECMDAKTVKEAAISACREGQKLKVAWRTIPHNPDATCTVIGKVDMLKTDWFVINDISDNLYIIDYDSVISLDSWKPPESEEPVSEITAALLEIVKQSGPPSGNGLIHTGLSHTLPILTESLYRGRLALEKAGIGDWTFEEDGEEADEEPAKEEKCPECDGVLKVDSVAPGGGRSVRCDECGYEDVEWPAMAVGKDASKIAIERMQRIVEAAKDVCEYHSGAWNSSTLTMKMRKLRDALESAGVMVKDNAPKKCESVTCNTRGTEDCPDMT